MEDGGIQAVTLLVRIGLGRRSKVTDGKDYNSSFESLYGAVGGVSANIAEGYSRKSGKDQARYYEYALGSAREAKTWYVQARYILGEKVLDHRLNMLTHIIKQLLVLIPADRGHKISEQVSDYIIDPFQVDVPFP
ncbi:MAG: four helix bundle protein [Chloroflexi bacterium]|nr:four helix bundle protein [Chloroflexota bacterium]